MGFIELKNDNKFSIPVIIRNGDELNQVMIAPKSTLTLAEDQVTDSIVNLTRTNRRMLTLRKIKN